LFVYDDRLNPLAFTSTAPLISVWQISPAGAESSLADKPLSYSVRPWWNMKKYNGLQMRKVPKAMN
jgi:hypothetical protein